MPGFESTSWSLVLGAKAEDTGGAREALNELCKTYWPPLYAFFRSRGCCVEEAQDLTQELFCCLLRRHFLAQVEQGRGRFRTFLLVAAENLLREGHRRDHAQRRGGEDVAVPLDPERMEPVLAWETGRTMDPRLLYDRQWAQALLDRVLVRLEDEFSASGRSRVFTVLQESLVVGGESPPYRALGEALGMSEGAVKTAVYRLRKRYGELLREEVGKTVEGAEQVEEELHYLFEMLTG